MEAPALSWCEGQKVFTLKQEEISQQCVLIAWNYLLISLYAMMLMFMMTSNNEKITSPYHRLRFLISVYLVRLPLLMSLGIHTCAHTLTFAAYTKFYSVS
jgi:hypothetical protein